MTCLDCGHQTANNPRFCPECGSQRFQNTDSMDDFWNRFRSTPKLKRYSRSYDYSTHAKDSGGFFSGWWPLKLLFFPFWLIGKALGLALRILF